MTCSDHLAACFKMKAKKVPSDLEGSKGKSKQGKKERNTLEIRKNILLKWLHKHVFCKLETLNTSL